MSNPITKVINNADHYTKDGQTIEYCKKLKSRSCPSNFTVVNDRHFTVHLALTRYRERTRRMEDWKMTLTVFYDSSLYGKMADGPW